MRGLFIKCPWSECKKMMLKDANLRPGSFFTMRCYHCGTISTVYSDNGQIRLRIDKLPEGFTDDEDSDMVTIAL